MNKLLSLFHELLGLFLDGKVTEKQFDDFIAQFREKTEAVVVQATTFVSEFFRKATPLAISADPIELVVSEEEHNAFWAEIKTREKEKANPDAWIDDDAWKWFNGKTIAGFAEAFISVIYRFLMTITHRQILDEAEKKGIKKIYTLKQARLIIKASILLGEVDTLNKSVFAYFKIEGNDQCYRLRAFRRDDGKLHVDMDKVDGSYEWLTGFGVCLSN